MWRLHTAPGPWRGSAQGRWRLSVAWHEKVWDRARRKIGLLRLGFHDLRRVYASALVAEAIDVKVSQELMGLEDPRLPRDSRAMEGGRVPRQS